MDRRWIKLLSSRIERLRYIHPCSVHTHRVSKFICHSTAAWRINRPTVRLKLMSTTKSRLNIELRYQADQPMTNLTYLRDKIRKAFAFLDTIHSRICDRSPQFRLKRYWGRVPFFLSFIVRIRRQTLASCFGNDLTCHDSSLSLFGAIFLSRFIVVYSTLVQSDWIG